MTLTIQFEVPGTPVAKGRPRFARRGNFVSTYTPAKTKEYEARVREAADEAMQGQLPLDTPILAIIKICVPVPASYSKTRRQACLDSREMPTKKPDWDNVAKAITDSLNGVVYMDDAQIVSVYVSKRYSEEAGVEVTIREEIL